MVDSMLLPGWLQWTLVDLLTASGSFSTFNNFIVYSNLEYLVSKGSEYCSGLTISVPYNDAFIKLRIGALDTFFRRGPVSVQDLLLHHIFARWTLPIE